MSFATASRQEQSNLSQQIVGQAPPDEVQESQK